MNRVPIEFEVTEFHLEQLEALSASSGATMPELVDRAVRLLLEDM